MTPSSHEMESPAIPGRFISGAFPDLQPEHEQHLTDAVHAFARALFGRGLAVIFGNHPTLRPLILEAAHRYDPNNARNLVRMYTSRYFVSQADIDLLDREVTVIATPEKENDRALSLTQMRGEMIQDQTAIALVAMGGKTGRADIPPGIDEEIKLAVARNLPVFILGAVGGRSAELASKRSAEGWAHPFNKLSQDENERLRMSLDFDSLADMLLGALGR